MLADIDTIGVVGLGDMGFPIATTILKSGIPVKAFDIRQEPLTKFVDVGGELAESQAELADDCQSVHLIVANDQQALDVVFGETGVFETFGRKNEENVLVIHSTLLPNTVEEISTGAPSNVHVMDVTVSGGSRRAEEGDLTVMVGGPDEVVERYKPILESIARNIYHLGPIGSGTVAKLTNNAIYYAATTATLEALSVGTTYGIDEEQLLEIYQQSSGGTYFAQEFNRITKDRPKNHPLGAEGLIQNKMCQYLELTTELEVPAPVGGVISQMYPVLMADAIDTSETE